MRTLHLDWKRLLCFASILCLGCAAASAGDLPPQARNYEVHQLSWDGYACGVGGIDDGVAVGSCLALDGGPSRAFIWSEATGMTNIGTLGGSGAGAAAIDNDRVAGSSLTVGDSELHPFLWTRAAGMLDLGTLGGTYAAAGGISGAAVIGDGTTIAGGELIRGFLWTPAAGMIELAPLPGGDHTFPWGVHGNLVAGYSTVAVPGRRPVAWRRNGEIIDLVPEPIELGTVFVKGDGEARAVRQGLVAGYRRIDVPEELSRAFAWSEAAGFTDLGVVGDSTESFAYDTDGTLVVGELTGGVGGPIGIPVRAFVWSGARGMTAITPKSLIARATHVRNGRVVGTFAGLETNGTRVFLWTRTGGLVDVTQTRRRDPGGWVPAAIDGQGRIALVFSDEDPLHTRSVVLVPRGH
jgi:hypothetical protein